MRALRTPGQYFTVIRAKADADKAKARNPFTGIDWPVVFVLAGYHVGAVAAFFYYSWEAVAVAFALAWITGGLGITLGYHRLLTHRSFETYRPIKWLLALCGVLASQGSPVDWVACHRKHHQYSDHEGDPHTPTDGAWWSHMLWLVPRYDRRETQQGRRKYAADLLKDPGIRFLHHTNALWYLVLAGGLFAAGWLYQGVDMGIGFVVWGMFVRLLYVLHVTWAVNSATHMWGYRNYETKDQSRNLWWVGLAAWGEGWHNNHHAYPRMARHGHKWWEFDMTYITLKMMEKVGLAWNIVHKSAHCDDTVGREAEEKAADKRKS